jgi:hypothetical protein
MVKLTRDQLHLLKQIAVNQRWKLVRYEGDLSYTVLRGKNIGKAVIRYGIRWSLNGEVLNARVPEVLWKLRLLKETEKEFHYTLSKLGERTLEIYQSRKEKQQTFKGTKSTGRRSHKWHEKNDPKIVALRQNGRTPEQIAKEMKISPSTARRVLKKHGLIKNYRRLNHAWLGDWR